MADFCGDSTCAARFLFWRQLPHDERVVDPCPTCLDALVALLGVPDDTTRSLQGLRAALVDAGRLP